MATTITIALDWAANPNHAGLIVAQREGYFTREGVDVQVLPAEAERTPAEVIQAGGADLAFAFAGTVMEARSAGVPLVSVAAVMHQHHSSLVALRSSGIARPAHLQGKRYASFGQRAIERAVIAGMMRADGVADPQFDLDVVRFASFDVLANGEYDFMWIYDAIEGADAQSQGLDLVMLAPSDYGVPNYYAPILIAHADRLADPELAEAARRALRALRAGYELAWREPDAVFSHFTTATLPEGSWALPSDAVTQQSFERLSRFAQADALPWGQQQLADWQEFGRFLWAAGTLGDDAEPDFAAYFTNDLLA
ncbi:MAG: ABC transporter substrate-binding protein [Ktedonobacterales bacterium]|nr:ABC transporter substrate-binding protein [Ktedonobacterales bacterium]